MSSTDSAATTSADLMPFEALGISAETFLKALVAGEAPAPIMLGGELFFRRETVTRWRYRLAAFAAGRYAEILTEARDD